MLCRFFCIKNIICREQTSTLSFLRKILPSQEDFDLQGSTKFIFSNQLALFLRWRYINNIVLSPETEHAGVVGLSPILSADVNIIISCFQKCFGKRSLD
jgi:hypothetical protein